MQAAFYVSTGVWPLLHRRSFERVTGPKTDFWLAQTVGLIVAAIGIGLAQAASRERGVPPELRTVPLRAHPDSRWSISRLSLDGASRRSIWPTQLPRLHS